jgi:hypothetical protein
MKTCVSCLNALFRGTKLAKEPFYSIGNKRMFGRVSEHFSNPNALFWGPKVAKHPFYSIGTKMMFGSVSEHLANLWHVKRCRTCVRAWMHYSGTKVAKHPFYSIGPKVIFGSVSEHFANLWHVKISKTCVSGPNALFRVTKLWSIHSIPLEPRWWLAVFQSISLTLARAKMKNLCSCPNALLQCTKVAKHPIYSIRTKMMIGSVSEHFANPRHVKRCKICIRAWMHCFGVPKLRSIQSTPLEPKWCLGLFQSILLTFGM